MNASVDLFQARGLTEERLQAGRDLWEMLMHVGSEFDILLRSDMTPSTELVVAVIDGVEVPADQLPGPGQAGFIVTIDNDNHRFENWDHSGSPQRNIRIGLPDAFRNERLIPAFRSYLDRLMARPRLFALSLLHEVEKLEMNLARALEDREALIAELETSETSRGQAEARVEILEAQLKALTGLNRVEPQKHRFKELAKLIAQVVLAAGTVAGSVSGAHMTADATTQAAHIQAQANTQSPASQSLSETLENASTVVHWCNQLDEAK